MIMQTVNLRVGVHGMGDIRGLPGITGTEDWPVSIGLRGQLGSTYRRGRSPLWLKVKNPKALAVIREAEEDWGK
jgi:hypothetical protein